MKTINQGIYPVMLTLYDESGNIDYNACEKLVRWYGERGCNGVFAACLSSEIFHLSLDERVEIVSCARKTIDRYGYKMSLVASGHVSEKFSDQAMELNRICEAGADSVVLITNRFDREGRGDVSWINDVEKMISVLPDDISIGFYECPYPIRRPLTAEMLRWMKGNSRISFIKDTCCNLEIIKGRLEILKGSGVMLFNANEQTLLDSLRLGCAGFSGVMCNFNPEMFVSLYKLYKTGDKKSQLVQDFITAMTFSATLCYPLGVEYVLKEFEGIDNGIVSRSHPDARIGKYEAECMTQLKRLNDWFYEKEVQLVAGSAKNVRLG